MMRESNPPQLTKHTQLHLVGENEVIWTNFTVCSKEKTKEVCNLCKTTIGRGERYQIFEYICYA